MPNYNFYDNEESYEPPKLDIPDVTSLNNITLDTPPGTVQTAQVGPTQPAAVTEISEVAPITLPTVAPPAATIDTAPATTIPQQQPAATIEAAPIITLPTVAPAATIDTAPATPAPVGLDATGYGLVDGQVPDTVEGLQTYINFSGSSAGVQGEGISLGEGEIILGKSVALGLSPAELVAMTGGRFTMADVTEFVNTAYPTLYGGWLQGTAANDAGAGGTDVEVSSGGNAGVTEIEDIMDAAGGYANASIEDALAIYKVAIDEGMTASELSLLTGVPVEDIRKFLEDKRLRSLDVPGVAGLDTPPAATTATATTAEVTENQTAAYQLQQMLNDPNGYIKQAFLRGERNAARRGLINSSIAGGMAEAEAIRAAGPIAINDANTYSRQALANQDATNTAANLNAQLETDMTKSVVALRQSEIESVRAANVSLANSQLSAETQRLVSLASDETRINLQTMSDATQTAIEEFRVRAGINADNLNSKTTAFANMISSIGTIEANPELTSAQKSAGIKRTVGYYDTFLDYVDKLQAA